MKNLSKNLSIIIALVVIVATLVLSGCVRRGYRADTTTSTGVGHSDRLRTEWNSAGATVRCVDVRNAQDTATTREAFDLLRVAGLLPTAEHGRTTVPIRVQRRAQMESFCEASAATAENGGFTPEVAQATRAYCADRLGPNGISADTETSVEVEVEPPPAPVVDPRVQEMILPVAQQRLYFGLFMADAQRYCQDREASAPVFMGNGAAPGFASAYPMGASFGGRTFGSGGLGASVFGRSVGGMGGGFAPMGAGGFGSPVVGVGHNGATRISVTFTLPRDISASAQIVSEQGVLLSERPAQAIGTATDRIMVARPPMGDTVILQWQCSNGRTGSRPRTIDGRFFSVTRRDCDPTR